MLSRTLSIRLHLSGNNSTEQKTKNKKTNENKRTPTPRAPAVQSSFISRTQSFYGKSFDRCGNKFTKPVRALIRTGQDDFHIVILINEDIYSIFWHLCCARCIMPSSIIKTPSFEVRVSHILSITKTDYDTFLKNMSINDVFTEESNNAATASAGVTIWKNVLWKYSRLLGHGSPIKRLLKYFTMDDFHIRGEINTMLFSMS